MPQGTSLGTYLMLPAIFKLNDQDFLYLLISNCFENVSVLILGSAPRYQIGDLLNITSYNLKLNDQAFLYLLISNCLSVLILGSAPRYQIGDLLNVSCYSLNSRPAAKLKWYINGEEADPGKGLLAVIIPSGVLRAV